MGVDQTWYDNTPAAIHDLICDVRSRNLIRRPDGLNDARADSDRPRGKEIKTIIHRGDGAAGQDCVNLGHCP
jgi:hypothetical protein